MTNFAGIATGQPFFLTKLFDNSNAFICEKRLGNNLSLSPFFFVGQTNRVTPPVCRTHSSLRALENGAFSAALLPW
jgi:hypothetical protein